MLCFTLVLCTVGRSAPDEKANGPSPQIKKEVKYVNETCVVSVIETQATVQECTVFSQVDHSVVAAVIEDKTATSMEKAPALYREDLRRRVYDMSYKINKPPNRLKPVQLE